ncbi:hypothetical protein QOZ80_1BG0066270 [Eleusine coracana subsp. coracana]|nr:hypothetical protein QOZ80_1BG0066270 [Eleusine coracana subsp. coracana]
MASLLEASGDSESDDLAAAAATIIDADDGDVESCSGGDDDGLEELHIPGTSRLVSWGCWIMENASAGAEGAYLLLPTEDEARNVEGDRLFWEACIAHGYQQRTRGSIYLIVLLLIFCKIFLF